MTDSVEQQSINPLTGSVMTGVQPNTGTVADRDTTCTICLEEMGSTAQTSVHAGGCGVCFHASCLYASLTRNGRCPSCRLCIQEDMTLPEKWELINKYSESRNEVLVQNYGPAQPWLDGITVMPGYREQATYLADCVDAHRKSNISYLATEDQRARAIEHIERSQEVKSQEGIFRMDEWKESERRTARKHHMCGILATTDQLNQAFNAIDRKHLGEIYTLRDLMDRNTMELQQEAFAIYYNQQKDIHERYIDNIGYFAHMLQQQRAVDPRKAEWEADPVVPL